MQPALGVESGFGPSSESRARKVSDAALPLSPSRRGRGSGRPLGRATGTRLATLTAAGPRRLRAAAQGGRPGIPAPHRASAQTFRCALRSRK